MKAGTIVKLKKPYKPDDPEDNLVRTLSHVNPKEYHDSFDHMAWENYYHEEWPGFTHGIVVFHYAPDHAGNLTNVDVYLYDPQSHLMYLENGLPVYVKFHVEEFMVVKKGMKL